MIESVYRGKTELSGLLEPGIYARLADGEYLVECVDPRTLVSSNRLDVSFRALYLKLADRTPKFAESIYSHDLRSQTLGSWLDPDSEDKRSFQDFRNAFEQVVEDLGRNGFDPEKTLIPVSSTGTILNGGHRLAAALHLGIRVWVVRTGLPPVCCDHEYFYNRAVPATLIEMAVSGLVDMGENFHLALLWPSGKDNWAGAEELFPNVAYRKDLVLTFKGAHNLLYECYKHMDWIGTQNEGLPGIQQKRMECFPEALSLRVLVFQEKGGLDRVRQLKQQVREINGIGFSSIHITDTHDETVLLAGYVLNDNGMHFLNHANWPSDGVRDKIKSLSAACQLDGVEHYDVLVDGSLVLEAYGLRQAEDVDILCGGNVSSQQLPSWERHDAELEHHGVEKQDLIYNPRYYFLIDGTKIVGLDQLLRFKRKRGERKDVLDVELARALLEDNRLKRAWVRFQQSLVYARLRVRRVCHRFVFRVLTAAGVYDSLRSWWRRVRGIGE